MTAAVYHVSVYLRPIRTTRIPLGIHGGTVIRAVGKVFFLWLRMAPVQFDELPNGGLVGVWDAPSGVSRESIPPVRLAVDMTVTTSLAAR